MRRRIRRTMVLGCVVTIASGVYVMYPPASRSVTFPDGKRFAFSIVDDTDLASLERVRPLYDILYRHGLRTTKTVWVLESRELSNPTNQGDSLQDADYRAFILGLQDRGFEIALHGVRGGTSERTEISHGLAEFERMLGAGPRLHVNHAHNRDNVYWGAHRWSFPPLRWLYALALGDEFSGHDSSSPFFWGDLVQERIEYVNQFTFSDINLLNVTSSFPYHLPDKPYVNLWFPTSNGGNLDEFEALLSADNLDRLEREGGVSLVYAHLGAGSFNRDDATRFEDRIRDLVSRDGWFAPASEILDYLQAQPGWRAEPSWRERVRLEILFIWDKIMQ